MVQFFPLNTREPSCFLHLNCPREERETFFLRTSSLQKYLQVFHHLNSLCTRETPYTCKQGQWFVPQPVQFSCDYGAEFGS